MADDVKVRPSTDLTAVDVATDEVASRHYQWMKPAFGPDGTATPVQDTAAGRLPVGGAQLGATDEAAAGTDTATSGLIGLVKRLLQRITTLIGHAAATETSTGSTATNTGTTATNTGSTATNTSNINNKLPAALTTNGGALKDGSAEVVITASIAATGTLQSTGSDLAGLRNWGVLVPSTFDGTQIQFQMSDTLAGTYVGVYDITNTRVIMTVAASRYYDIPGELMGIRFLKIECLTVQATTDTNFLLIGKT